MANLKKFIKNNEMQLNRLNNMTDPLRTHFGIDVFWYNTISEDGHYTSVSTCHDLFVLFNTGNWLKNADNLICPSKLKTECNILGQVGNFKNFQDQTQETFPLHHPMSINRKESEKKAHVFGFASKKFNPTLPSIYINHLPLLTRFLDYFLKENECFQGQSDEMAINLAELRGAFAFYGKQHSRESSLDSDRNRQFLRDIGVDSFILKAIETLSPRQKQVLAACVEGKTAAETADEIMLSTRTVQNYLDIIKDKLGVSTKAELIQCGRLLKLANLLDS